MRKLILAAAVLTVAASASAATRLTYTMADKVVGVKWPQSAFPIKYQVDSRLVNALPPGTVDRAFGMWSGLPDASISFQGSVVSGVRDGNDTINEITLADGLFKNQNALAMTNNWYDKNGMLTEADIEIDASLPASNYNVQQALAHEIGHLLGLDHSAVLSAIMFPYLTRNTDIPQLDSDDRIAMAAIYPNPRVDSALSHATLQGRVTANGTAIFAAQVVAVSETGEPVATALTDATGDFTLTGLPAGTYRLYAEPLDGPVDARNLAGVYRDASATSFPTRFYSGSVHVEEGQRVGNIMMAGDGAPPDLNPRWVGVANERSDIFSLSSTARTVKPGQTIALAVAGDGITGGMTQFEVLNPGFTRSSDFRYAANYVYADFRIAPDAAPGSAVIFVKSGNQSATLTGALRIQGNGPRGRVARH